jgi:uncharacterized membrane protein
MIELAEYAAWFLLSVIGLVILYLAIRPFFKYIPPVWINGWTRLALAVSLLFYPVVLIVRPMLTDHYPLHPTRYSNLELWGYWFVAGWIVYFAAVWIARGFNKKG